MADTHVHPQTGSDLPPCQPCKGTGQQNVTVSKSGEPDSHIKLTCIWCKGTGRATPEQQRTLAAYDAMWCRCGNPSGESNYFSDGQHPAMHKHHYRCADCNSVTQVG